METIAIGFHDQCQIDLIHPTENNNRDFTIDQDINSLAASIMGRGLLQPLQGRPHPTIPGHVELILGERRLRACKALAHETIRIEIVEVSDAESHDRTIIENLQRQDLTALEESAGVAALLITHGHDTRAVAAQIGKTDRWVRSRAKLNDLSPAWRAAIATPGAYDAFGVGHLALIARHPEAVQDRILHLYPTWSHESPTVGDVECVCGSFLLPIAQAPFAVDETVGERGPCVGCPTRSDAGLGKGLFDPVVDGDLIPTAARCLEPTCYRDKNDATIRIHLFQAAQDGSDCAGLLGRGWKENDLDRLKVRLDGVLYPHQWERCEEEDEEVSSGIILSGHGAGEKVRMRRVGPTPSHEIPNHETNSSSSPPLSSSGADEESVITATLAVNLRASLLALDAREADTSIWRLLALAVMYGVAFNTDHEDDWDFFHRAQAEGMMAVYPAFFGLVRDQVADMISSAEEPDQVGPRDRDNLVHIASAFGITQAPDSPSDPVSEDDEEEEEAPERQDENGPSEEGDELLGEVRHFVTGLERVGLLPVQREFGIGYGRASALLAALEEEGVIGPSEGVTGRPVLMMRSDSQGSTRKPAECQDTTGGEE